MRPRRAVRSIGRAIENRSPLLFGEHERRETTCRQGERVASAVREDRAAEDRQVTSDRTVGEVATDALLGHLAARPSKQWLFTMEEGEPLNYRRWKTEWNGVRKVLQAAENGAAEREGREDVELSHMVTHDLRHFCASALIAGGVSGKQVQLVFGRVAAVITLRTQAHLWPGKDDRTRSGRGSGWGGLRAGCGRVGAAGNVTAGQAFLVSQKILSIWAM
ncbi:tyrosine-type recombinase/integrase [Streptomyces sp. NPDC058198]|uniref:tyrosine-type recombinase/integrase n=1 Tax=Streptomyces sp. NPDC058198 TaxID=3346377 RepID=UPI0036DFB448